MSDGSTKASAGAGAPGVHGGGVHGADTRDAGTGGVDWAAVRELFPATREGVYLNTASYAPGPTPVLEEVRAGLDEWSLGRGSWRVWEARAEETRALFAGLLECEPGCVSLQSSLSSAAGQVAACLEAPRAPGEANLVVGADEFRSNFFPWVGQERRGFEVRQVPFREGAILADDLLARVDECTRLVAVSHVQSANGYRVDLARLAEGCRARGARLFVDATQSLGGLRVPLDGVDYLATAAYKWLLSPRGAAFLYVAPDRLGEMFPIQPSWKTPADPYERYYGAPFAPAPDASGLDVSLAWPIWLGTARALELLSEVGLAAIEAHNLALAARFREGLRTIGLEPLFPGSEPSPIVALRVPDPEGVKRSLAEAGIQAAIRDAYVRTSFHLFNDERDVERTLAALDGR